MFTFLPISLLKLPPTPVVKLTTVLLPLACGVALAIVGGRTQPPELPEPQVDGEVIGTEVMQCTLCSRDTSHTIYRTGPSEQKSECQTCGCLRIWRVRQPNDINSA